MINTETSAIGINYFEDQILNNSNTQSTLDSLKIFLGKQPISAKEAFDLVQIIDSSPSEQKISDLFEKLNELKHRLAETNPKPLDMETHEKNLRVIGTQMTTVAGTRKHLKNLKQHTEKLVDGQELSTQTIHAYGKEFGKNIHAILQNLIIHAVKKLEMRGIKGPDFTQWSAIVLGSLAREEGHPYSDIDLLILVDPSIENDEQTQIYFKELMQEFADTIHHVGEEAEGFKLCGGNITPPYALYDYRYSDNSQQMGGMGSFIASPERMAGLFYQSAVSFLPFKNKMNLYKAPITGNEKLIGATLLDAKPIFGNPLLFERFTALKNQLGQRQLDELFDLDHFEDRPFGENTTAKQLAYRSILSSMVGNRTPEDFEKNKLNLKKDFMRPIQMGISVLANQFGVTANNTVERINAFTALNLLTEEEAEIIKSTYLQLYHMRIEESCWFKGENDEVILSEEVFPKIEERMRQINEELEKLYAQESESIALKVSGKEAMDDLIKIRQFQDAYANEHFQLSKLVAKRKVKNRASLDSAKTLTTHVLRVINRYIQSDCDKSTLARNS